MNASQLFEAAQNQVEVLSRGGADLAVLLEHARAEAALLEGALETAKERGDTGSALALKTAQRELLERVFAARRRWHVAIYATMTELAAVGPQKAGG